MNSKTSYSTQTYLYTPLLSGSNISKQSSGKGVDVGSGSTTEVDTITLVDAITVNDRVLLEDNDGIILVEVGGCIWEVVVVTMVGVDELVLVNTKFVVVLG